MDVGSRINASNPPLNHQEASHMKRILIIEDDPLIANIYQQKFNLEGFLVDVATDGKDGLKMVDTRRHDLVLLDLMLPVMNGVEVLKAIRVKSDLRFLPVVVFSNCYLTDMVEAAKRAGATQVLTKASHTPRQVVEIVCAMLTASHVTPSPAAARPAAEEHPPAAQPTVMRELDFQSEIQRSCLQAMPGCIETMRRLMKDVLENPDDLLVLHELYLKTRSVATNSGLAGLPTLARLAAALEALLKELHARPDCIQPAALRTVSQCLDFLLLFCRQCLHPEIRDIRTLYILIADPSETVLQAVNTAFEKAHLKVIRARTGAVAEQILADNTFDLLLLNWEMPDMPGAELLAKARSSETHRKTPAVFMTPAASFDQRLPSCEKEGCDLLATPFLPTEAVVKALTLILKSRIA
jgi:DNA-binding response OmpR family regulator